MKQEVLINNLVGILYQGLFLISKATYIDKESGRDKRFGEIPVIRVSKTKYIYISGKKKKENSNNNQDDDDDVYGIEHVDMTECF